MLVFFKYLGWLLSSLIAAAGSWKWKFTIEDSNDPSKLRLTKPGKIAFKVFLIVFSFTIIVSLLSEIKNIKSEKVNRKYQENLTQKIENSNKILNEMDALLARIYENPSIREKASEDPELASLLDDVEERIGGSDRQFDYLNLIHPNILIDRASVLNIVTFNMRNLSHRSIIQRENEIATILRGLEADIFLLQEVNDEKAIIDLIPYLHSYSFIWKKPSVGITARREGMAILYKKSKIKIIGEARFIEPIEKFTRAPLIQSMKVGTFKFDLVNIHLNYGDVYQRKKEIEYIADWILKGEHSESLLIAGVFQDSPDSNNLRPLNSIADLTNCTLELTKTSTTTISMKPRLDTHFILYGTIVNKYIERSIRIIDLPFSFQEEDVKKIRLITDRNPMIISLRI